MAFTPTYGGYTPARINYTPGMTLPGTVFAGGDMPVGAGDPQNTWWPDSYSGQLSFRNDWVLDPSTGRLHQSGSGPEAGLGHQLSAAELASLIAGSSSAPPLGVSAIGPPGGVQLAPDDNTFVPNPGATGRWTPQGPLDPWAANIPPPVQTPHALIAALATALGGASPPVQALASAAVRHQVHPVVAAILHRLAAGRNQRLGLVG